MRRRGLEILAFLGGAALVAASFSRPESTEVNYFWYAKDGLIQILLAALGASAIAIGGLSWRRPERWLANPRLRAIAVNLLLAALSSGFVFLTVEWAFSAMRPLDPLWTRADPKLHHVQIPGIETRFRSAEWDTEVRINSLGLRDDEVQEKVPSTLRILVLGDSFTWGFGVERGESWVDLLEQRLRSDGGAIEIVNGGVPSYSPMLEYLYLRDHGLELEPDVVLLAFDMSDLQDDFFYEQSAEFDEAGELVAVLGKETGGIVKRSFKSLRLLRLLRSALDQVYARHRSGREFSLPQHTDLRFNRFALTRDDVPEAQADPHWRRSLDYLDRIHQLTEAHGIPMILLGYPYGHQASTLEWTDGRHHYGFAGDKVYGDHPARRLSDFAAERGIFFVSLFDAFREEADGGLYFAGDGHFTVAGHELAARVLNEKLGSYLDDLTEPSPPDAE